MAAGASRDHALTSEVLRLRRRDEAEALAILQVARRDLEQAIRGVDRAGAQKQARAEAVATAERAFAELRGSVAAGWLQQTAEDLRQRTDDHERAAASLGQAQAELARCHEALQRANQDFLQRRGQREAAELFAAQQASAARRLRANRMRVVEEEARDRFASAKPRRSG
jgi:hypothetical protein